MMFIGEYHFWKNLENHGNITHDHIRCTVDDTNFFKINDVQKLIAYSQFPVTNRPLMKLKTFNEILEKRFFLNITSLLFLDQICNETKARGCKRLSDDHDMKGKMRQYL